MSKRKSSGQVLPWKVYDGEGVFVRLVLAENALDASANLPEGHSIYVGGPSPQEPTRRWWAAAWAAGEVDPDDLLANDPRPTS